MHLIAWQSLAVANKTTLDRQMWNWESRPIFPISPEEPLAKNPE
jgi:hypothetical protein